LNCFMILHHILNTDRQLIKKLKQNDIFFIDRGQFF
jgi:hypothetical protein